MARRIQLGSTKPLWTKLVVGAQVLIVIAPLLVVVLWAIAAQWSWPSLVPQAFSLRGLVLLLTQDHVIHTLVQSVVLSGCASLLATACAYLFAHALVAYRWAGKRVVSFAILLPFLVPAMLFAMGVQILFIRLGLAGSFVGVVLAHALVGLPYAAALLLDALQLVGTKFEQAARCLGASGASLFFHIQLPLLMPAFTSAFTMAYIVSFSQYFLTLLIGAGRVKTFALALFSYLTEGDRTVAAVYGVVFIVTISLVGIVFDVILKRLFAVPQHQHATLDC